MPTLKKNRTETLDRFLQVNRDLATLRSIKTNLSWDQETMMPSAGAPYRARQTALMATIFHQKITDPAYGEILDELESADLDEWNQVNIREARRERDRATKVPESLVQEIARTCSLSYQAWVKAREESDLKAFLPWLEKVIRLKREQAKCLADGAVAYDALLEEYEPGMTVAKLDPVMQALRPGLSRLLERIRASKKQPDESILSGRFPQPKQEELGRAVITAMGFNWEAGRLDVSPHPFCCGLNPGDVRITTRYSEEDFSVAFFGMVHEAGHGLYEQNLRADGFGQPAFDTISLGIHESQSRLWEIFVARSRDFWKHWFPLLQATFPDSFRQVELDPFLHAINRVKASLIRVDADEVSYGLHVILRYEIEKALFDGSLEVEQVESVWNQKMQEYLGLTPPDAASGVLQDVHWSHGLLGYFPTYLLGTVYANQLYQQAHKDIPNLADSIARGRMLDLLKWLRHNVHHAGRRWTAVELVHRITGRPLDPSGFLDYLNQKYEALYELS